MSYKLLVMKFIILLAAFYTAPFSVNAQSLRLTGKTTIYLVRHEEKEEGNDPGLTTAGKQRAGDLMRLPSLGQLRTDYFPHIAAHRCCPHAVHARENCRDHAGTQS